MFKKIVVPLDGRSATERALGPARAIAAEVGVPMELLYSRVGGRQAWPRTYLHAAADRNHVETGYDVRVGKSGIQKLLDGVVAEEEALVCMTSESRIGVYERLFGSVGTDLIHTTPASFLVVGPRAVVTPGWRPAHVVVCTDGSDTSRAIVPVVADWQAAFAPTVKVLQVVSPAGSRALRATEEDATEANVVRLVAEELGDGTAVDWDVLHSSDAARAILDEADAAPDTVIAMATHGRSGLARVKLGSVTDAVIAHSKCPVLTVRPQHLRGA